MPHGALERADVKGQTPLLIALRYGHDAAAHSLLQLGANPLARIDGPLTVASASSPLGTITDPDTVAGHTSIP